MYKSIECRIARVGVVAGSVGMLAGSVLAEGSTTPEAVATELQTYLEGLVASLFPIAAACILAFVGFKLLPWVVGRLIGMIKGR